METVGQQTVAKQKLIGPMNHSKLASEALALMDVPLTTPTRKIAILLNSGGTDSSTRGSLLTKKVNIKL